jgi:imidazolonepropionase-like amidohydrolase
MTSLTASRRVSGGLSACGGFDGAGIDGAGQQLWARHATASHHRIAGDDTMRAMQAFAIVGASVFDGDRRLPPATVLVERGTIAAIAPRLDLASDVAVIDGTGRTLLPGLIDAHAHVHGADQLERALAFGVTTVLDMGSWPPVIRRLKAQLGAGTADLRSAGLLVTAPGGHGTQFGRPIPTLAAPEAAAAFIAARIAEGADYIKLVFDDGRGFGRSIPTLSVEVLRAAIDAAHAAGRLALVHIGDCEAARTAIEAGADAIAHLFCDRAPAPDFGALVARQGAFVMSTLGVLRTAGQSPAALDADPALAPFLDADARATLAETFPFDPIATPGAVEATVAQLRAASVPILCGTDAPNPGTAHGASVHDELALLVAAGLPPVEALAAATARPARAFGLADRGTIAAGRRADLVLVDGDPTTTIADTRKIVAVWRGGVAFDREAYRGRIEGRPSEGPPPRCGCGT